MGSSVFKDAVLGKIAISVLLCYDPPCSKIVLRCRSEFRMQRARDIGHRRLNLVCDIWALLRKLLLHIVRRFCDQLLKKMSWYVFTEAKLLGENRITFRAFDLCKSRNSRSERRCSSRLN